MYCGLEEILRRQLVSNLPVDQRELYVYITSLEDQIAEYSPTPGHYLDKLSKQSPHQQAASKFHLSFQEVYDKMNEIEDELYRMVQEYKSKVSLTVLSKEKKEQNWIILTPKVC
ncbi:hypothetical protein [Mangrovibacillus cuniculi]|uniref:Uncharacterized protein n=1 Tax=Mangrovibacillus cuniculi TaxID=2593652 RepID=A0A7S8HH02_9BACI|nr:hypothetical protein [Mangrovibacillus cuniculi]QPC48111.1 hypothetical protein G8O30_14825 [Mangrovibacillus cuniculi]